MGGWGEERSSRVEVDPEDVRVVVREIRRTSSAAVPVIAAADRLAAIVAPSLFDPAPAPLPDPAAPGAGRRHRHAGETETSAARSAWPRFGTQRMTVLAAIAKAGDEGLTDHELADETGLFLYSCAPRRTELLHGGWVRDSGRRRTTPLGAEAAVWVLADAARARLNQQAQEAHA